MKLPLGLSGMIYWEFCRVYCLQLNKDSEGVTYPPRISSPPPLCPPTTPWPPPLPTLHPHYTMTKPNKEEWKEIKTKLSLTSNWVCPLSQVPPCRKWHHTLRHKISFKNSVTRKRCRYDLHVWGTGLGRSKLAKYRLRCSSSQLSK